MRTEQNSFNSHKGLRIRKDKDDRAEYTGGWGFVGLSEAEVGLRRLKWEKQRHKQKRKRTSERKVSSVVGYYS
jgi:hypothetical protein